MTWWCLANRLNRTVWAHPARPLRLIDTMRHALPLRSWPQTWWTWIYCVFDLIFRFHRIAFSSSIDIGCSLWFACVLRWHHKHRPTSTNIDQHRNSIGITTDETLNNVNWMNWIFMPIKSISIPHFWPRSLCRCSSKPFRLTQSYCGDDGDYGDSGVNVNIPWMLIHSREFDCTFDEITTNWLIFSMPTMCNYLSMYSKQHQLRSICFRLGNRTLPTIWICRQNIRNSNKQTKRILFVIIVVKRM